MPEKLFTYFGNKSRVSDTIWGLFGSDCKSYVEPFCGSASVLLRSPVVHTFEAINDVDCYVVNAHRAVKYKPDEVIEHLYNPRAEIDLWARHDYLVNHKKSFTIDMMREDAQFCDPILAAWWIWGINLWIGGNWCSTNHTIKCAGTKCKPAHRNQGVLTTITQKPAHRNQGVLTTKSEKPAHRNQGVLTTWYQKPVHRNKGVLTKGVDRRTILQNMVMDVFDRLVDVNILCGDWRRLVTPSYTSSFGECAIFLDPPYASDDEVYENKDSDGSVFDGVKSWFIDNYKDDRLRIVMCGEDRFWPDCPDDVHKVYWSRSAGYNKNRSEKKRNEVMWCSDACLFGDEKEELGIKVISDVLL